MTNKELMDEYGKRLVNKYSEGFEATEIDKGINIALELLDEMEEEIKETENENAIEAKPIKQTIKIQFGSFVKMLDAKTIVQVFAQDESLLTEKKAYQIWDSPFYDIYHDWDIVAIYSGFGTVIKVQIIPELEN